MVIDLITFHQGNQVVELIGVRFPRQNRRPVESRKGFFDGFRLVGKIQHIDFILARRRPIQPGQGLDGRNVRKGFVYIHSLEQRFVKARLEHVGHDQQPVRVLLEFLGNLGVWEAIHLGRSQYWFLAVIATFPGKSDDSLIRAVPVGKTLGNGIVRFNATGNTGRHHHGARLAAQFLPGNNLFVEMIDHHRRFLGNDIGIPFDKGAQFLLSPLLVKHGIVFHLFGNLIPTVDGHVILQHIQDEAFLNGLFHSIDMEGPVFNFAVFFIRRAKYLFRFIFWGGRKGKIAGRFYQFPSLYHGVDFVFIIQFAVRSHPGKGQIHTGCVPPALSRMGFVDDDSKGMVHVFLADFLGNIRELLDCRHNDPFAILDSLFQVTRMTSPYNSILYLHELFDDIPYLLVQNPPVRYDDDRINHRPSIPFQSNQLMGQPGNGIGFARPGAVLDEIAFSHTVLLDIGQEFFYTIQLMIARPDLFDRFLPGFRIFLDDDLGIILDDTGQFRLRQDIFPQVVRHDAFRVGRIPGPIVVPFIERQEPAGLSAKFRTELNRLIIYGKMYDTALEGKQQFPGIAVFFILFHSIGCRLSREMIFQLYGNDGQTVDEQAEVQCQFRRIDSIAQLSGNAENILVKQPLRLLIVFCRREIEQNQVSRIGFNAIAQHVDNAAPGDFSRKAVQKLPLLLVTLVDAELVHFFGLSIVQKAKEPGFVDGVFFVVVFIGALLVTILIYQPVHDERFKTLFRFIRKSHGQSSSPGILGSSSLPSPPSATMSSTCS